MDGRIAVPVEVVVILAVAGPPVFDWGVFRQYLFDGTLVDAAKITLSLAVLAQCAGVILGVLAALGKTARLITIRIVVELYIWLFRGTPVLVQLLFWSIGLPHAFPVLTNLSEFQLALIALALNEGAYMSEIVRAGLEAVDTGQNEAALSLGMRYSQIMRRIILPQALRVIIPPTGNELISMLKTTSLASTISLTELTLQAQNIYTCSDCPGSFKILELLSVISIYYLSMTTVFSIIQAYIESRLGDRRTRASRGIFGFINQVVDSMGAGARR